MVIEEGIVLEVNGDKALVQPERSDRCEGCSTAFCITDSSGRLTIEAKDPIGVRVGQRIRLAIKEQSLVWYSFILYGVPLLSLFISVFAGSLWGRSLGLGSGADIIAIIGGFSLTAVVFLNVKRYIRHHDREPTYRPVIIEIVNGKIV